MQSLWNCLTSEISAVRSARVYRMIPAAPPVRVTESEIAFCSPNAYPFCMAADLSYRYLTRVPGIRSGNMIVANTRIGVHDVVGLIVNGASVDDVVRSFPELTRAQVYECLAYYEDHRDEIDWLV